jgi:hypothetical protein
MEHDFDRLFVCRRCNLTKEATIQLGKPDRCWQVPWENNYGDPPRRPEQVRLGPLAAFHEATTWDVGGLAPSNTERRTLSDPPAPGYRRDAELTGWPIDPATGEEIRPPLGGRSASR